MWASPWAHCCVIAAVQSFPAPIIPTWHVIGLIKYIVCWLKLSHSFSFAGQFLGSFDPTLGSLPSSCSCWALSEQHFYPPSHPRPHSSFLLPICLPFTVLPLFVLGPSTSAHPRMFLCYGILHSLLSKCLWISLLVTLFPGRSQFLPLHWPPKWSSFYCFFLFVCFCRPFYDSFLPGLAKDTNLILPVPCLKTPLAPILEFRLFGMEHWASQKLAHAFPSHPPPLLTLCTSRLTGLPTPGIHQAGADLTFMGLET